MTLDRAKPMNPSDVIRSGSIVLTDGAVVERLRRDPALELDPHILHAGFASDVKRRPAIEAIYREYLDIAADHDLPILVGAPTWRANPERVRAATNRSCEDVNREGVELLRSLRTEYGGVAERIWIAGLMGCRGDAYDPSGALSSEEAASFHLEQASALAAAGAELLLAATLPAASEAVGIARAMSTCGLPYAVSVVLLPTGTLLDGTPLHDLMAAIDRSISPPPLYYGANCVHPAVFANAMESQRKADPMVPDRLIGLQANTSTLSPEKLDGSDELHTMDPDAFGDQMLRLHTIFGTRILGGCCGTDGRHLRALARALSERI